MLVIISSVVLCVAAFPVSMGTIRQLKNLEFESTNRTSGITAADVDNDGRFEMIVAVLDGPNLVLKYDIQKQTYINMATNDSPYEPLMDSQGRTASVCACDFDGDGREEIYIHNVNPVYGGITVPDKLYKWHAGGFENLFEQEWNDDLAASNGGYSVSCIDYLANGRYAFLVTTYTKDGKGAYLLLAMNDTHPDNDPDSGNVVIVDVTKEAGLNVTRDGRGISVGPLFGNSGKSDIIVTNDNSYYVGSSIFRHLGNNAVFRNNGDGTFTEVAEDIGNSVSVSLVYGLSDADENSRAVSLADLNYDGYPDILYMNWLGPNRFLLQNNSETLPVLNQINDDSGFITPAPSDIMIIADFDNDGNLDVITNGADEDNLYPKSNKMFSFSVHPNTSAMAIVSKALNNKRFEKLQIKGISTGDLNSNGILEAYVSHKMFESRTLSIFEMPTSHNWIRILPQTALGSAAKGAIVTLTLSYGNEHQRIIGEGCGYMCHVEPIAHFGLANKSASEVSVQWPDGHTVKTFLHETSVNKTLAIAYTGKIKELSPNTDIPLPTSDGTFESACYLLCFIALFVNTGL